MPASAISQTRIVLAPGLMCDRRVFAGAWPTAAFARLEADLSIERMGARLLAENPGRLALIGFSMGAMAALEAARQAPERVAALVLISANGRPEAPERQRLRMRQIARVAKGALEAVVAEDLKPAYFTENAQAPLRALTMRMAIELGPHVFTRQSLALMSRPDLRPAAERFAGPLLAVTGGLDALTPAERGEELASLAPRGRHVVLPDCGHMAPLEAPGALTTLVDGYFKETLQ